MTARSGGAAPIVVVVASGAAVLVVVLRPAVVAGPAVVSGPVVVVGPVVSVEAVSSTGAVRPCDSDQRKARPQPETAGARPATRSHRPVERRKVLRSISLMMIAFCQQRT